MSKRALSFAFVAAVVWSAAGCGKTTAAGDSTSGSAVAPKIAAGSAANAGRPKVAQLAAPLDVRTPPADAIKTASGLIYKKLVTIDGAQAPGRNDTVLMHYTGWKPSGETFFTTRTRGQPMPLNLSTSAPAFTEALQLIHQGEKVMLWVPPSIGFKGTPQPGAETLAYEIEVMEIQTAPVVPPDVGAPPATAKVTADGVTYVVVKPGTPNARPTNPFDTATFHLTGWDSTGKMFDTSELRKRPITSTISKQPFGIVDALTSMNLGERRRMWIPTDKLPKTRNVPTGLVCYELELLSVTVGAPPPEVPKDVAAPPKDARKTPLGVFYKVLTKGAGKVHPTATDTIVVHYSGWTTDGKAFDSSVARNSPAELPLNVMMKGWKDGVPLMVVGDKFRFWIPVELAYNHQPNKPEGMLVFDVELRDIKNPKMASATPPAGSPGGAHPGAIVTSPTATRVPAAGLGTPVAPPKPLPRGLPVPASPAPQAKATTTP